MSRNVISIGVIWIVEKSLCTLCTLFNVTKQLLIRLSIERSFAGISTLIYNIVSSPFWFQSTPKGLVKSLISNSLARKQSSILVSAIIKIMTVPLIWSVSKSDLILTELILLGATISFLGLSSKITAYYQCRWRYLNFVTWMCILLGCMHVPIFFHEEHVDLLCPTNMTETIKTVFIRWKGMLR